MKNKKKIVIILQARTLSSRLPGKVLLPLSGYPLVVLCAKRLSNKGHKVIVAIPKNKSDDYLNLLLKKNNLKVFRGDHNNVFKRYEMVIKKLNKNDIVVRATADNPLPDGNFVEKIVNFFLKKKIQYLDTHKNFNLPYGLAIQVFYAKNLIDISNRKLTKSDMRHVVSTLDRKKDFYRNFNINYKIKKKQTKLSIDTLEDYLRLEKIFRQSTNPIRGKWINFC